MKTFHELNMHDALYKIREELGEDAVIISSKQDKKGVQVVAATDYDVMVNTDNSYGLSESHKGDNFNATDAVNEYTNNQLVIDKRSEDKNAEIRKEIQMLRDLIESQTEIISWNKLINDNPITRKHLQKLSISGFGFNLSKKILSHVNHIDDPIQAWNNIKNKITQSISILGKNVIESGGIVALVGPTGVGKTTTIAKIAAQYALKNGNKNIALISTDHYRIGAHDQISTYASILNVPVIAASNKNEMQQALNMVKDKKLILIDTPGLCQRDKRVDEIMETISSLENPVDRYLVISATSQLCVLKDIVNRFNTNIINGVVVSKTDEASQIGGVLTVLIEQNIPLAFETNGQRVPEDIIRPERKNLLIRAIKLGKKFTSMEDIHPTELFSGLIENV